MIFGEVVIHEATEARVEDHRFLEGSADSKDHAADRLRSRGLFIQDAAGSEDAQHASYPDLSGIDIDADFGKVRAIGLLREFCARGAGFNLAVGIDAFRTDQAYERRGLTSGFNPAIAEAGAVRLHARERRQFCSQSIAGVEQG